MRGKLAREEGECGLSSAGNQDRPPDFIGIQHRGDHASVGGEPLRGMGSILEGTLMMQPIYCRPARKDTWTPYRTWGWWMIVVTDGVVLCDRKS